jgi:hypothetical protein
MVLKFKSFLPFFLPFATLKFFRLFVECVRSTLNYFNQKKGFFSEALFKIVKRER